MLTATATRKLFEIESEERRYMPLQLKGVLNELGISQREWALSISQTGSHAPGKPLSHSAASQLLNWNVWPKTTPRPHIKAQTEAMLRGHRVPESTIKKIWSVDENDEFRHTQPVDIQTRKALSACPELRFLEVEMLSAAAKKHFQIFKDPFVDDVQQADDVFLSGEQRYIREAMYQTAKHGGFLAIVGESGSGKTTLRRDLLDRIQRESLPIVPIQPRVIDKGRLSASLICEAIIRDLSTQKPRQTLEGKARQVEDLLITSARAGNVHVLLIEEAHDLTISTLKYLKRFWELEDGFKKLLSIILVGQPELKHMLNEQRNPEAREVIRRCEIAELAPLNEGLEEYLALKFKRIGKKATDVLSKDAYDAIRAKLQAPMRGNLGASLLYPLIVNNLVTKALNLCAGIGEEKINTDVIKAV